VSILQKQVATPTQQIAQLKLVISIHSGGTVTIQASDKLNFSSAGGNLNLNRGTIDLKAAITWTYGIFKADTMMITTISAKTYSPSAVNICC
jgi:hypothetical protein